MTVGDWVHPAEGMACALDAFGRVGDREPGLVIDQAQPGIYTVLFPRPRLTFAVVAEFEVQAWRAA